MKKGKILDWMHLSLTRLELEKALEGTFLGVSHRTHDGNLVIVDDVHETFWVVEKEKNYGQGIVRYEIDPAFESFLARYFKKDLRA